MMPSHPLLVHFPLALSVLTPLLGLVLAILIRKQIFSQKTWFLLLGVQLLVVGTGYLAMNAGERDEKVIKKLNIPEARFIGDHENAAEMFVSFEVVAFVLILLTCFIKELYRPIFAVASILTLLVGAGLGFKAGELGGRLTYEHHLSDAFMQRKTTEYPVTF